MLIAKMSSGRSAETGVPSADVKKWRGWAIRWRLAAGRSRRGVWRHRIPGRRSSSDVSAERRGPWSTPSAVVVWNLCPPHGEAGWRAMVEPYCVNSKKRAHPA